jgi:hypothetical protein
MTYLTFGNVVPLRPPARRVPELRRLLRCAGGRMGGSGSRVDTPTALLQGSA